MIKKIKRSREYELTLSINDDSFIDPPKESQRNSMLNRALFEFTKDLSALDKLAKSFVPGSDNSNLNEDRSQAALSDEQIMEDWQLPIMQAMADVVCQQGGDILEVGFGRGISSDMIQKHAIQSHTIIECNQLIIEKFNTWKSQQNNDQIIMVEGKWQDTIDSLPFYDGIFFHTYPLNQQEYMEYVHGQVTFAQHFFEVAARHLKPGGIFSYFSNEIDSLSRAHQRELFKHFQEITLRVVKLRIPEDVQDTWWADRMVVVKAVK